MDRDEFYTASEAAKVLGKSERWVRQLATDGTLEGERTEEGWKLLRRSVHEFRDAQSAHRSLLESSELSQGALDTLRKVEDLQRALGRLEGEMKARAELTEVAESTLREQLQREQERADKERERAEQERLERQSVQEEAKEQKITLEEENQKLREELQAERAKGFWQRLFGRK